MRQVMLDIGGILVRSNDFEADCHRGAIVGVVGTGLDTYWCVYRHVTDSGILYQHLDTLGLTGERESIFVEVRSAFVARIRDHLDSNSIEAVPVATVFVAALRRRDDISLSIATGGWRESAGLKLRAAGIDVDGIPLASADDHFARSEIKRLAVTLAVGERPVDCSYFGNGEWDQAAGAALGYDFVLVGGATFHRPRIADFDDLEQALGFVGI